VCSQAAQQAFMAEVFVDALKFGGAVMIRRIVGIAHVNDFRDIKDDNIRYVTKQSARPAAQITSLNSWHTLRMQIICHSYASNKNMHTYQLISSCTAPVCMQCTSDVYNTGMHNCIIAPGLCVIWCNTSMHQHMHMYCASCYHCSPSKAPIETPTGHCCCCDLCVPAGRLLLSHKPYKGSQVPKFGS